jgi:DMSO/TMAO reductase YedYZ molybdopterin-dependent catalytic subunit
MSSVGTRDGVQTPLRIAHQKRSECMLAFEMNGQPLFPVYGTPLRLRVENQLGYKMYFDLLPDI